MRTVCKGKTEEQIVIGGSGKFHSISGNLIMLSL